MSGSRLAAVTAAAALFVLALPATAALYKWTDANGHVVYSDQPPNADVKLETLRGVAPPANPNAARELAQTDAELRKRVAERSEAATRSDKELVARAQRSDECSRVAGTLKQLDWAQVVLYRVNEKGEQVAMDEAARQKERARLEDWSRQNCP
jgi:hypothetical protein